MKWKGLGYLDGERPFEPEDTDLDRDLDAERRDCFFTGDLLKAYPIFISGYLCIQGQENFIKAWG